MHLLTPLRNMQCLIIYIGILTVLEKFLKVCLGVSMNTVQQLRAQQYGEDYILEQALLLTSQVTRHTLLQYVLVLLLQVTSVVSDSVRPHRRQPTRLRRPWDSPGKNTGVGFHFLLHCVKVKSESEVAQWCLTLGDPMDCSPPGSSIHGIFQARALEWGASPSMSQCTHL